MRDNPDGRDVYDTDEYLQPWIESATGSELG